MIDTYFSEESLAEVWNLLYAENSLAGECGQKEKREARKGERTPEQQKADDQRSSKARGKDAVPSSARSEGAKKAAETRRRCSGLPPKTQTTV